MEDNTTKPSQKNGANTDKIDELSNLMSQAALKSKMESRGVPERFWELPKFQATSWNKHALETTDRFIKGEIEGIFFTGGAGTGKTSLCCKILHEVGDVSAKFVSVPMLLSGLRDSYKDKSHSNLEFVQKYVKYDILVLDDLGAEKTTDWTAEVLYLIINGRYEKKKGIIVTTNCTPLELGERLGERIISRLAEMCVKVSFNTNEDWRVLNWKT